MNCAHALVDRRDGSSFTACGLSIADEHAGRAMFAETLDTVSCAGCRQQIAQAHSAPRTPPALHPKAVVTQLIEQAINGRDAECLAMTVGGEFAARFGAGRITRLHELFEDWRASISELIAESETVVARYTAACVDRFGLLGAPEARLERQQTVIFQVREGRVTDARAVVDDFGIWDCAAEPA
jgi:ketosteroid isomerase-like protein